MRITSAKVLVEQLTLSSLYKAPDNLDFRPVLRLEEYLCRWKRKKLVCHMFGITLTPIAFRIRIFVIFIRLLLDNNLLNCFYFILFFVRKVSSHGAWARGH